MVFNEHRCVTNNLFLVGNQEKLMVYFINKRSINISNPKGLGCWEKEVNFKSQSESVGKPSRYVYF